MKRDIHNYAKRLENVTRKIKESTEISDRNKSLILDFLSDCRIEKGTGLSLGRITRYGWSLYSLAQWIGKEKDFDKAEKEDIKGLVRRIEGQNYKDWTKHFFRVTIKKFYKWLNGGEDYPENVRWIKCSTSQYEKVLPEGLLTPEEVKKIIEAADHPRDKAFFASLYESGCRPSELILLSIRNVLFDEYGAQLIIPQGKTGMRRVRLIASVPYLSAWINSHPFRDNPEASLWISIGSTNHGLEMGYNAFIRLLERVVKKVGIQKKVNLYRFRKSRATHLAPHLKEFQMDYHFGWVLGSKAPRHYIALSGRDIDPDLLEFYGLKKKEEKPEDPLKPKACQVCQTLNQATGRFCNKCGKPLELKTVLEMEDKKVKDEGLIIKLLETPGLVEKILASSDENVVQELMRLHPNLQTRITAIAIRNFRNQRLP